MTIVARYINIDARIDRRAFFEEQAARLGLVCARIPAVTPADIKADDINQFCTPRTGVRPAELACIRSHLKMIADFVETDEPMGAFFEDDAVLSATLPNFLDVCARASNFGYHLIRLDHARRVRLFPAALTPLEGFALHEFRSTLPGASGYLLTRQGAQRLLDYSGWGDRHYDLALYDPLSAPGKSISRALVNPALVVQYASRHDVRDLTGVGLSDINPKSHDTPQKQRVRIGRINKPVDLSTLVKGLKNAFDHFGQLNKGMVKARIRFKGDSPLCDSNSEQP